MRADRTGMVARLYSFATLSDEEEPTRKAAILIAAFARDFEEAGDTDIRQIHTVPMAKPPVRGPLPASDAPPALQSGVVRCLTPISMERSLGALRATAANEVTMAPDAPPVPRRGRAGRGFSAALLAGASLVVLYALGMRSPRLVDTAPHVAVVAGASFAHETPRRKQAPPVRTPLVRRAFTSATPLPPPVRSRSLVRTPPF